MLEATPFRRRGVILDADVFSIVTTPAVVDLDTVREIYAVCLQVDPSLRLTAGVDGSDGSRFRVIEPADLDDASPLDLSRLEIQYESPTTMMGTPSILVQLTLCRINFSGDTGQEAARRVAELLNACPPRRTLQSRWFRHLLSLWPVLAAAVMVGAWVWYLTIDPPHLGLAVAGSGLIVLAARTLWRERPQPPMGGWGNWLLHSHKVERVSRREVDLRRADNRRDWKVTFTVGPVALVLGFALNALLDRLF
ncbi:hypothetical protein [Nocardioides lianchengensis]|uniref:hypothetical protein n=1 Tax=Nocardioides lianchengensis TaxID=1045774 RepID=UPI00147BAB7B|nr:hypothetical protein [Nocardioides lianchengensis]NYG08757.1 hypothetical protein [Nocardioides lianchengensis]